MSATGILTGILQLLAIQSSATTSSEGSIIGALPFETGHMLVTTRYWRDRTFQCVVSSVGSHFERLGDRFCNGMPAGWRSGGSDGPPATTITIAIRVVRDEDMDTLPDITGVARSTVKLGSKLGATVVFRRVK
ncbi:hypothetical protein [Sphingosinicella sp.]|uniref:hypothetical protein n=1 Tax=Sphingosinicella sp. TaxID=1917971 RepID=UPI004037B074